MADFTQTINNTLEVWGGEAASRWGTMLWGEKWAYGSGDLAVHIQKYLDETLTLTGGDPVFGFYINVDNTLTTSGDLSGQYLIDMDGWYLFFDGTSNNAESRLFTPYTDATDITTSYTTATDITTTWSRQ